jgi:hypothetical protein
MTKEIAIGTRPLKYRNAMVLILRLSYGGRWVRRLLSARILPTIPSVRTQPVSDPKLFARFRWFDAWPVLLSGGDDLDPRKPI